MTDIFPIIQPGSAPDAGGEPGRESLPPYRDVLWDGEHSTAIWSADGPVMVDGLEALRGWIWRALSTVRKRWPIFSHDYGTELEDLVGRPYTPEVRQSEALRLVREALAPCPYIIGAELDHLDFTGGRLTMGVVVSTIYGEVIAHV